MTDTQTEAATGAAILKEMVDGLEGVTPGKWLTHSAMHVCEGDVFAPTAKMIPDCHRIARCFAPKPARKPLCSLEAAGQNRAAVPIIEANAKHIARCCPDNIRAIAAHVSALEAQIASLETKVFVPGLWKCAKCKLSVISSNLNAQTGRITANDMSEPCPNGCGPLWRVSERDAGNDLCNRLDDISDKNKALEAENKAMREALKTERAEQDLISEWPDKDKEIFLLHEALRRYGDWSRMGTVEPQELQQAIDRAHSDASIRAALQGKAKP